VVYFGGGVAAVDAGVVVTLEDSCP
jgi:hypothetical protein